MSQRVSQPSVFCGFLASSFCLRSAPNFSLCDDLYQSDESCSLVSCFWSDCFITATVGARSVPTQTSHIYMNSHTHTHTQRRESIDPLTQCYVHCWSHTVDKNKSAHSVLIPLLHGKVFYFWRCLSCCHVIHTEILENFAHYLVQGCVSKFLTL